MIYFIILFFSHPDFVDQIHILLQAQIVYPHSRDGQKT